MLTLIFNLLFSFMKPEQHHPVCELMTKRVANLPDAQERLARCDMVAWAAAHHGLDVPLMVELAWAESNFTNAVNPVTGCAGVLQAQPKWSCPGGQYEGCDLVQAGINAWRYWFRYAKKDSERALCHYNSGNTCSARSLKWARMVKGRADKLRLALVGEM